MMRIPVAWLRELVATDLDADALAAVLTDLGLEIEGIEDAPAELGDKVLVAEVTPNRGDCLSLVGIAREVAAKTGAALTLPALDVPESDSESIAGRCTVTIDDAELCPRYSARLVLGVTPGPSPAWMQRKLLACGQRPIDILVDVTNYVLFELGQPLHAFDHDLLGATIGVRRALGGETIATLDGVERELTPDHLLITNGRRGVALAGVMGGASTAVSSTTRNVLLESAHFHAPNIRRTARTLGLESESSYRFARTVDPGGTVAALDRCAQLLAECAGGTVARGVVDAVAKPMDPVSTQLRPQRCNAFLGLDLSAAQMVGYLTALGLDARLAGETIAVTVPTRRPDLTREVDLIEEIGRLYGYNNVPMTIPRAAQRTGRLTPRQKLERRARELALAAGLNEVWTFSLTSEAAMRRAGLTDDLAALGAVRLRNALSGEFSVMRWSLLPSLLEVVSHNVAQHTGEVRVFEIGRTYTRLDPAVTDASAAAAGRVATGRTASSLPVPCREQLTLAGAVTGTAYTSAWNLPAEVRGADLSQIQGLLDLLRAELRLPALTAEPGAAPWAEPGRASRLRCAETTIAVLGEVAAEVLAAYDIRRPVVVFEANLDWLLDHADTRRAHRALPRYPAALRDLALVVPDEVSQAQVEQSVRAAAEHLETLALFDVYRGKGVADGARSLAYSLSFRHAERTLTDAEVDAIMAAIVARAEADCGARLRV